MARASLPPTASTLLALVFSITLLLVIKHTSADCKIRFVVDSDSSNVTLGGRNALVSTSGFSPTASITQAAGVRPTFQGALFITIPSTTGCPTSLPTLAQGLEANTWYSNGNDYPYQSAAGPYQGISIQPAIISGLTAGSTYQPQYIVWNITTSSVTIDASSGTIRMKGPVSMLQGFLWTKSIITSDRYDNIAPGSGGNFTAVGSISIKGSVVSLSLTTFNITWLTVGSVLVGSTTYTSITTMTWNGAMKLNADLSCKQYCGDSGRCTSVNGTSGCQCECGWKADKTGACLVPSGYCPTFSGSNGSSCDVIYIGSEPEAPPSPPATVGYPVTDLDEGAANTYRPIIAFIPFMIQLMGMLGLGGAMLLAWPWICTQRAQPAAPSGALPAGGGAGAKAVGEGVDAPAAARGSSLVDEPTQQVEGGDGQVVVLQLADEPHQQQQQQQQQQHAPTLRFDSISVWVAPSFSSALAAKLHLPGSSSPPAPSPGLKRILLEVSGEARASQLLGLMGPSGSGKSTLLNVLSGQIQSGGRWRIGGALSLDQDGVSARQLSRMCAHVPQHDLLLSGLTVEECLRYAAAVRLGSACSPGQAAGRVEQLLQELHIAHIRAVVAGAGSSLSISGGERQRVSLGMELVADSRLLLLDEPTSGLDAFNALHLVRMLARVARGTAGSGPRIVVASLHQPSPTLFSVLDEVILLAAGRLVFSGPPAAAAAAFSRLGLPCPGTMDIGEHMLMAVGDPQLVGGLLELLDQLQEGQEQGAVGTSKGEDRGFYQEHTGAGAAGGQGGARLWSAPELSTSPSIAPGPGGPSGGAVTSNPLLPHTQQQQQQQQHALTLSPSGLRAQGSRRSSQGLLAQLLVRHPGVLFWRSVIRMRRSPALLVMHLLGAAAMGIIVGFVFFKTQTESTAGIIGRLGTIFYSVNVVAYPSLSAMDMLLDERHVVERELTRGYYSPATYMLTKLLVDGLLLRTLPACVYAAPFYWIMGLRPSASAFTTFLGLLAAFTSLIGALVMLLTTALGSPGRILIVTTTLLLVFALFSGFLANEQNMHWALRWICYVSPFRWTWEALVINEVRPLLLELSVADLPSVTNYPGHLFLVTLGVDPTQLTSNIIVVVVMYVGLCMLAILSLYLRIGLKARGWIL